MGRIFRRDHGLALSGEMQTRLVSTRHTALPREKKPLFNSSVSEFRASISSVIWTSKLDSFVTEGIAKVSSLNWARTRRVFSIHKGMDNCLGLSTEVVVRLFKGLVVNRVTKVLRDFRYSEDRRSSCAI
jgi:hypothetical protein